MKALLIFLLFGSLAHFSQTNLKEYDKPIELKGKLITELYYGAPGYGEDTLTDKKVYPFILVLEHEIDVKQDAENEGEKNIKKIQLSFPYEKAGAFKKLKNKRIVVKGKLFHSQVASQYTPVLIDVTHAEVKD